MRVSLRLTALAAAMTALAEGRQTNRYRAASWFIWSSRLTPTSIPRPAASIRTAAY